MTDDTDSGIPEYQPPRRGTPKPEDTPLDPSDKRALERELSQYPDTGLEREVFNLAKQIRSAEARAQSQLRKTTQSTAGDIRDATINRRREMMRPMGNPPAARRAKSAQSNLKTLHRRWADLVERYFNAVRAQAEDDSEGDSEEAVEEGA